MKVRIGRKRANDKLSIHMEIDGQVCRRDIQINVETATRNVPAGAKLCRRCYTPERIKTAQLRSQSGGFNAKADTILCWAVDMTRSDAEKAHIAELVARYHAQPVEVVKPRSLAELRSAYAHTHKQAADRGGYVRIAA